MMNPNVGRSVEVVGFVRLALLRPRERHRFGYAFPKVLASISWYAIGAFVITLALLALTRRRPRSLGLCLFLPALGVIMTLLVVCVYAVGPFEVSWWLATSLSRCCEPAEFTFSYDSGGRVAHAHVPRGHTDARTAREGGRLTHRWKMSPRASRRLDDINAIWPAEQDARWAAPDRS